MVKLNLGCGDDIRKGYVNIDVQDLEGVDLVADVRDLPFEEGEVEEIVAQDLLEHFKNPVSVLKEWYRILKTNGIILIRVPDFEKCIDKEFIENTPFYRTENRILGGRKDQYDIHKSLFTKEILEKRLEKAGFSEIKVKKMRKRPLHWHLAGFGKK